MYVKTVGLLQAYSLLLVYSSVKQLLNILNDYCNSSCSKLAVLKQCIAISIGHKLRVDLS